MMMKKRREQLLRLFLCLICGIASVPSARAELSASQVMIVANANSPDSLRVARHYAGRRGIPLQQIANLDLPFEESMSRKDYDRQLVVPLRRILHKAGLHRSIRVLVTVYGVPLRVSAQSLTDEERRWRLDAKNRLAAARSTLMEVERKARDIPGAADASAIPNEKGGQGLAEFDRNLAFLARIDTVTEAALKRANAFDPPTRQRWYARVEAMIRQYQGIAGVTQLRQGLPVNTVTSAAGEERYRLAQQAEGLKLLLGFLELPVTRERDTLYRRVEDVYGAYGLFALAALELKRLSTEEADGSLDSELSLLWRDGEDYGLSWRQANALHHGFKRIQGGSHKEIPLLMVSRLDAPTVDHAVQMVDRAIEAERQGLAGTIYLDARGLPVKDQADAYGRYDQSLRDLHGFVTQQTTYRSVLENTEARFQRPGDAPDVALYAGWYRLRQYEDAFTFRPGAIGYHMASAEAVSIHNSMERGWCKNALERGITATLGSVGEPYLDSFPEPLEFISLMMTGQYSLVEAYYLTSRWVSWRMVLFGDPLYNPWKAKPAAQRSALTMFTLAPIAPSDQSFDDPVLAREEFKRLREQSRTRLDMILRNLADSSGLPPA